LKNTFGKSRAAQQLEKMVADNTSARRKISSIFCKYNEQMMNIVGAKDPNTVRLCWELLRDYTLRRIDVKQGLTDSMRSYAKNVIISRYRIYRHHFDELISTGWHVRKKKNLTSGQKGL